MTSQRLWIVAAMAAAAGLSLRAAGAVDVSPAPTQLVHLPARFEGWRGGDLPRLDSDTEATLGADAYIWRTYDRGADPVTLFVAYYATQASGRTIHSPLNCLPGTGWDWIDRERELMPGARDTAVAINRYVARRGNDVEVVYYWYQRRSRVVASEYVYKLALAWDALSRHRSDGALVRVTAATSADREAAAFIKAIYPQLTQFLPE